MIIGHGFKGLTSRGGFCGWLAGWVAIMGAYVIFFDGAGSTGNVGWRNWTLH